MKRILSLLALSGIISAFLPVAPAHAANGYLAGHITSVFVSSPGNMAFRVTLDQALPSSCTDGFAYTDTPNGNYQAYVSALLVAYSTGKLVTLEFQVDGNGFCQITEFNVA